MRLLPADFHTILLSLNTQQHPLQAIYFETTAETIYSPHVLNVYFNVYANTFGFICVQVLFLLINLHTVQYVFTNVVYNTKGKVSSDYEILRRYVQYSVSSKNFVTLSDMSLWFYKDYGIVVISLHTALKLTTQDHP